VQPVPSTELGPAARDVCANGFSYASPEDAVESPAATSTTSDVAVGSKRNIDGGSSSADAATAMDTSATEGAVVSFGNDAKKVRHLPKGGNRTGKTDAEKTMLRSYLRQGVDR